MCLVCDVYVCVSCFLFLCISIWSFPLWNDTMSVLVFIASYNIHRYTHTLSWTTWLPAASLPASTAARALAQLIILLLIECRGTLQGWVIKLVQRMFVSTVYLSTAKRYIRRGAHKQGTCIHRLYSDLHVCTCQHKWCSSLHAFSIFVSQTHL